MEFSVKIFSLLEELERLALRDRGTALMSV